MKSRNLGRKEKRERGWFYLFIYFFGGGGVVVGLADSLRRR